MTYEDRPRVLVVEDSTDACELLAVLLTRWGYEVETACSFARAKAALAHGTLDVLVTDLGLLDGSGHSLLSPAVRTRLQCAVLITGYTGAAHEAESHARGFDAHFTKPCDFEALRAVLARHVPTPRARTGAPARPITWLADDFKRD